MISDTPTLTNYVGLFLAAVGLVTLAGIGVLEALAYHSRVK